LYTSDTAGTWYILHDHLLLLLVLLIDFRPTAKRMRQINSLQVLFKSVRSSDPALTWTQNWTSPVASVPYLAGELHPEGGWL
jgi:hypothetical protein